MVRTNEPVRAARLPQRGSRSPGADRLKGFVAWAAWLTVHLYYIIGFRNRAAVLASWGWNYLRRDRPIRIIAHIGQDPVSDEFLADLAEPDAQTGAADRTAGGET